MRFGSRDVVSSLRIRERSVTLVRARTRIRE
jgi:hypothetical protein